MWAMSWWPHISYTINATAPQFQHSTQIQKRPSWSNHIQHSLWVSSVRLPACRPVLRLVRASLSLSFFLLKIIFHFFWTSQNDIWSENMRFHFLTATLSRVNFPRFTHGSGRTDHTAKLCAHLFSVICWCRWRCARCWSYNLNACWTSMW